MNSRKLKQTFVAIVLLAMCGISRAEELQPGYVLPGPEGKLSRQAHISLGYIARTVYYANEMCERGNKESYEQQLYFRNEIRRQELLSLWARLLVSDEADLQLLAQVTAALNTYTIGGGNNSLLISRRIGEESPHLLKEECIWYFANKDKTPFYSDNYREKLIELTLVAKEDRRVFDDLLKTEK